MGYRSRAAFKLLEIDKKFRLLKPGALAIELGSAPGSWTQILSEKKLHTVAIDCLPMEMVDGCEFILGDFACPTIQQKLLHEVFARKAKGADIILSDVSPNRSGIKSLDQARFTGVIEDMLLLSRQCLRPGGALVAKVLQGADLPKITKALREFSKPTLFKPAASRKESAEVYMAITSFDPMRFDGSVWLREGLD